MSRWPTKPLVEICSPKQWPTISGSELTESGFPVYGANGQIGHYSTYNHEEPTILITCRGATCGTLNISPARAYVTGNAMALDNPDSRVINFRFLYYVLLGRGLVDTITGAAQPQITRMSLSRVSVPVPPLSDQERLVKLLDEADELQKLRAQADQRTDSLIPAIFNELLSYPDSKKWKEYNFGDPTVLKIIDGDRGANYPKKTDFSEAGDCLFLNTSNVRKGAFDFSKCDFITHKKDAELRKGKLLRDDVILTTRGTLGNTAHYDHGVKFENMRINSGMVILRTNPALLLPEYLLVTLSSDRFKDQVKAMTSGSAQPQLPISILSKIRLVLPPVPLQKVVISRIGEIRAMCAKQADSRQRLDDLFQSMLHRAFEGEL